MNFRHIRVSDLILVNHEGQVVEGKRPVNRAALRDTRPCTPRGPTSSPRAHAHSVYGKAFSSLGRKLDPITQDACIFFEDHALVTDGGGRIGARRGEWPNSGQGPGR